MRLRNIPGANEAVAASPYCIQDAAEHRGQWHAFFENDHPIHIEIGMGKGRFLMDLAALHPEINYIGIERYTSVLLRAVQKMDTLQLPNVHFLCEDAAKLPEIFAPEEVDRIYLNFSMTSFLPPTDGWNLKRIIKICLRFLSRKSKLPTAGILMPPPVTCTMIHP